jgi:hypothetical protein
MPDPEPLDIVMWAGTDHDISNQRDRHQWPFEPVVVGSSWSLRPTIHCHCCGCKQWLQFNVDIVRRTE